MLLDEALVIFACLNSTGCSETSSLYYSQHPELRQTVDHDMEVIKSYAEPMIIDIAGPIIYAAAGGTGTIKLNKYFSIQFNRTENKLTFRKEY